MLRLLRSSTRVQTAESPGDRSSRASRGARRCNSSVSTVTATLNDQRLDRYDRERVQRIVTGALGGEQLLTVDDGGGLHDASGARIGAIRRTRSGEWITER